MHAAHTAGSNEIPPSAEGSTLSPREREVLSAFAAGLCRKGIAHRLGITKKVVSTHKTSLLTKTRSRNDVQLGIWAARNGILGDAHADR